jgi:hypothetical protein
LPPQAQSCGQKRTQVYPHSSLCSSIFFQKPLTSSILWVTPPFPSFPLLLLLHLSPP